MGAGASKLSDAEEARLGRKCRSISLAYSRCHKANPGDARACSNLETSLVQCLAADLCKQASEAHARCYQSLINTGGYNGKRDCEETVSAMKACLKRFKLYPFEI